MIFQPINRDWHFKRGGVFFPGTKCEEDFGRTVHLPHDYMIESEVTPDAPAGAASGYFTENHATYTKFIDIPAEWQGERIYLYTDGVMMNAQVYVNGGFVKIHHYGYTPFYVDITDSLYFGEKNRISIAVNPGMQPNSRWYTGAGLYRGVELAHANPVHIVPNGIFAYTNNLEDIQADETCGKRGYADVCAEVTVENKTGIRRQVKAFVDILDGQEVVAHGSAKILAEASEAAVARVKITMPSAKLWDHVNPNLYTVRASLYDCGEFTVRAAECPEKKVDEAEVCFGVRVIAVDSTKGLRINGASVKLKGGCVHHDNGILGASAYYDAEFRKISALKASGYNAIRTAHNPISAALLGACDELGVYVFDEAFDAWNVSKMAGDYSQFFATDWEADIEAYVKRDRSHPAVIIWSTGNEVEERGGMSDGYRLAAKMAGFFRSLDHTRPVSNGVCSMWVGLDDKSMRESASNNQSGGQNADLGVQDTSWEDRVEAFCAPLDIVGYNYLDDHYELDHKLYPERVILGTESFPNCADLVWEKVENSPYVIGDFCWTAWDYIGEAGIGKSIFTKPGEDYGDFWTVLSSQTSEYPWRTANDADYTITGDITAQGVFKKIVWGSRETGLYVQHPSRFGLEEIVSRWGWDECSKSWNFAGFEGRMLKVYVYSAAPKVELFCNGKTVGVAAAGAQNRFKAVFEMAYEPGELKAVSLFEDGGVTEAVIKTAGVPTSLEISADKETLRADGESLAYLKIRVLDADGVVVPDAEASVTIAVNGADLVGSGSGNPKTADNYSGNCVHTWCGSATAVIRSRCEAGTAKIVASSEGLAAGESCLTIK